MLNKHRQHVSQGHMGFAQSGLGLQTISTQWFRAVQLTGGGGRGGGRAKVWRGPSLKSKYLPLLSADFPFLLPIHSEWPLASSISRQDSWLEPEDQ